MSAATIRRVVVLIGTARPRPIPATAVFTPTTRARPSASAPLDDPAGRPGAGREGPAEGAHDAGGDRAGEPHRVSDRDDELVHSEAVGVAEGCRSEVRAAGPHHRDVGERVAPHDLEVELPPVDEGGRAAVRAEDDVGGGEQEAVGSDGHGASRPLRAAAPADAPHHLQAGDRWGELLRYGSDDRGVGVEGLPLGDFLPCGVVRRALDDRVDEPDGIHEARLAPSPGYEGPFLFALGTVRNGRRVTSSLQMTQVVDDPVKAGREALDRHAWREAYEVLKAAGGAGRPVQGLEAPAEAAWCTARPRESTPLGSAAPPHPLWVARL